MSTEIHPSPSTGSFGPVPAGSGSSASHPVGADASATVRPPTAEPTRPPFRAHSVPHPGLIPGGMSIELRDVEPDDVAEKLRGMLGLPPEQPAPGEAAASYRRTLPPVVHALDSGGWIAWCLTGLIVFGEGSTTLAKIRHEAKRVGLALAVVRAHGGISSAARILKTSRKVIRENLHKLGLYPWGVAHIGDEAPSCEDGGPCS